jgi:hypothetical protein
VDNLSRRDALTLASAIAGGVLLGTAAKAADKEVEAPAKDKGSTVTVIAKLEKKRVVTKKGKFTVPKDGYLVAYMEVRDGDGTIKAKIIRKRNVVWTVGFSVNHDRSKLMPPPACNSFTYPVKKGDQCDYTVTLDCHNISNGVLGFQPIG